MSRHILAIVLAAASSAVFAQQPVPKVVSIPIRPTEVTSGQDMYTHYCAVCHGTAGKGNGPAASAMKLPPADLTSLARRNNGFYPADHVAAVLRFGTENPAAHGSMDMPIWSDLMKSLTSGSRDNAVVNLRISNLTAYIQTLQK